MHVLPKLVLGLIFASMTLPASAMTVQEVIQRHIESRGGYERIKSIQTLVYSGGTYREAGYVGSGRAFMAFMRPYFRVVGNPEDPKSSFMEGYDGSSWEWYAGPKVVVRTVGAAAGATRRGADFEGELVDYEEKGHRVALGETVDIGGRPAHEITVTCRDGFTRTYFIDASSFHRVAERRTAPIHAFGDEISTETRFSDFREVDGVLFPFHISEVAISSGEVINEMHWRSIAVNRALPRWWFSPPIFERTPLQAMLEQLFQERTDPEAVMWSYEQFRRYHPGVDTRDGIEFIGYQMLKMADNTAALPLLKANAGDYPGSAGAAFSLGRAHLSAGDNEKARAQFQRALRISPDHRRAAEALASLK